MSANYMECPCDLCGATEAVEMPHCRLYNNDQPIHICRQCGFVYVKYRRSAEDIAKAWSDDLYGNEYTARIPAVVARQRYAADFTDIKIDLKNKSVLDIGAGEGQFLDILKEYGAAPFGVEPSSKNCEDMSGSGLDCFCGTIEQFMAAGRTERYDVATILWTLENCYSCTDMLKAAHDLLKPGGHVVVATGSRILVPFKKTMWDYLGPNPADTHCFRFSANTLQGLLAIAGFKTVAINRYHDTDYLCVIGQKQEGGEAIPWKGDHFVEVYSFFERWHRESAYYINQMR
ncbi:MAG: class I SAM-dependent methyltransferase [Desulfovibrionaceae bacterium]|jgi:SAM-dependent methyltransferase|nr:class I SAM-dependent methyltransferase [Desulfovibrionaceae bacterium]